MYSGHQSILIPPSELEANPALWLLAVSQYKVRDTFCSYSVMELCTKGLGSQTESLKVRCPQPPPGPGHSQGLRTTLSQGTEGANEVKMTFTESKYNLSPAACKLFPHENRVLPQICSHRHREAWVQVNP